MLKGINQFVTGSGTNINNNLKITIMKRSETIERIPTWALCYIINDDPTGLSDEEIEMVDGFLHKWHVEIVSPLSQDGDAYFSYCPAFGLAADVEDCKVIYNP